MCGQVGVSNRILDFSIASVFFCELVFVWISVRIPHYVCGVIDTSICVTYDRILLAGWSDGAKVTFLPRMTLDFCCERVENALATYLFARWF